MTSRVTTAPQHPVVRTVEEQTYKRFGKLGPMSLMSRRNDVVTYNGRALLLFHNDTLRLQR